MTENFFNFDMENLRHFFEEKGQKAFRAQQLFQWIYQHKNHNFEEMTNISKSLRDELPNILNLEMPKLVTRKKSLDGTQKFLFAVDGGLTVESVLIPAEDRRTLCVSSEVGCNMACKFCYTGKQKLKRRLTIGEIVTQVLSVQMALGEEERISNIVFMGMGEPLDNTEAVLKASSILHSPWGLNLSRKKITVSTSGIVPEIPKVTQAGLRLAVSLNAVNDDIRSKIMPINKKWPIHELLEACRKHAEVSKDLVTIEYVLLKGVTDSLEDADKLYQLTRSVPSKLNIIPFNEHPNSGFSRPTEERIAQFQQRLIERGAHVLLRKTMGRDIYAACGQLTSAFSSHPQEMPI